MGWHKVCTFLGANDASDGNCRVARYRFILNLSILMGLSLREKHVVIVEDNRPMLELIRDFLSHEGYRISCYTSPTDALSDLLQENPLGYQPADLIIADVLMNPIHGPEFLSRIKAVYPDIPFILMSAFGDAFRGKIEVEGTRNGTFRFLHKPFSLKEFKALVREEISA